MSRCDLCDSGKRGRRKRHFSWCGCIMPPGSREQSPCAHGELPCAHGELPCAHGESPCSQCALMQQDVLTAECSTQTDGTGGGSDVTGGSSYCVTGGGSDVTGGGSYCVYCHQIIHDPSHHILAFYNDITTLQHTCFNDITIPQSVTNEHTDTDLITMSDVNMLARVRIPRLLVI